MLPYVEYVYIIAKYRKGQVAGRSPTSGKMNPTPFGVGYHIWVDDIGLDLHFAPVGQNKGISAVEPALSRCPLDICS